MAHGTSRGKIDPNFSARVTQLEERAQAMAEQFKTNSAVRPWHTPDALQQRDLLDVPSLHNPCWDRNNINQIYSEEVLGGAGKEGGTSGDLIAMKWQADFMAVEERAFRLRHASMARCASLMHGRLKGHGLSGTGVFSFFKQAVENSINVGRAHGASS
jgi:hypothetical protein